MKKFLLSVFFLLAGADLLFAGVLIDAKTSDGGFYRWACEGKYFRVETPQSYTIFDTEKGLMYIVMPEQKAYYVTTAEETRKQMEAMQSQMEKMQQSLGKFAKKFNLFGKKEEKPAPKEEPVKTTFHKTGKKAKIAGYKAYQVIIKENGQPVREIWASENVLQKINKKCDFKSLSAMSEKMMPKGASNMPMQQNQGAACMSATKYEKLGFPLKEISYADNYEIEVTKIETSKLPESYFRVPESYQKRQMPSMQGGMPW
ncbi:DUF4412 domain-containing protein [Thermodesulfatator atlanticus]|uniref:DUF4412 domain-containing protein n=1 Tax=Thermodesulfatator atlanticus TaxID=501497 RepID=UPI0003B4D5E8|nr:DUF4412 domain-containing protein [Thermodesulfatator atlanticus]